MFETFLAVKLIELYNINVIMVLQVLKTFALHNNIRPRVLDLSFIVTRAHQKIKALFCRINFDYTTNFVKKYFVFLSILLLLSLKK